MQTCQRVFVLTVLSVTSASGQTPDFSGTWNQAGLSDRVRIEKIEDRDPHLEVVIEVRDVPQPGSTLERPLAGLFLRQEFRTDGTEQLDTSSAGRQQWTMVIRQGPALIFLKVLRQGNQVSVSRERWTLDDGGKTLTKVIRTVNAKAVTEKTLTFERQ